MDNLKFASELVINGANVKEVPCLVGEGQPSSELGAIGCLYLDSSTNKIYYKNETKWLELGTANCVPCPEQSLAYLTVPVLSANETNKFTYKTVTNGIGSETIVMRKSDGSLRTLSATSTSDDTPNQVVINRSMLDDILANKNFVNNTTLNNAIASIVEATIWGDDIVAGQYQDNAIELYEYGMFILKGENITVSFGTQNNGTQTVTSDFHFIVKYQSTSSVNKILHLYVDSGLVPTVKSFDDALTSDIKASNGSSQYGCRVIKMHMKPVA